jgi:imidazolonepropionase-like amidohydrolase
MRKMWVGFLVVGSMLLLGASGCATGDGYLLTGSRVYLSPDAAPIANGVVVVRKGKIVAAGARETVDTKGAVPLAACDGGVIAAGFQNSHVHLTGPEWNATATAPAEQLSRDLSTMLTRYGFTTVVDTGSNSATTLPLRARIARGEVLGPRILTAGIPLYPHKGIPFYLRDLPPEILSHLPQPASAEEALQYVRANLDGGADATKLFVATPQSDRTVKYMARDVARAAAEETHARQRMVLAHPTNSDGIRLAIDSGVDVLVHTTIEDIPSIWAADLIKQLVARNMAVVPTLQLWPYEMKKAKLQQKIIDLAMGDAIEEVRSFSAAGGQILFGTDVGYMTEYDPTEEYVLLARALTPMQILASLTTAPAARWKESDKRGRLAAGMDADLVVMRADPAADVSNFAKVRCAIRQGNVIYSDTRTDAVKVQ